MPTIGAMTPGKTAIRRWACVFAAFVLVPIALAIIHPMDISIEVESGDETQLFLSLGSVALGLLGLGVCLVGWQVETAIAARRAGRPAVRGPVWTLAVSVVLALFVLRDGAEDSLPVALPILALGAFDALFVLLASRIVADRARRASG